MSGPLVWFGMYACHCSVIAERRDGVPHRCPECDTDLMAPPDACSVAGSAWGWEPFEMCGCWEHAGAAYGSRIYPGVARLSAVSGLSERSVRGDLRRLW